MARMHLLLQAGEQDLLLGIELERWLLWSARLLMKFAPGSPDDVRTWDLWLPLQLHAESLLHHAEHYGVESPVIAGLANY